MQAQIGEPKRPLLTIAIPTYNRSQLLRQLLDSLREQIVGEERVSLLVSDNASTDDTESAVQEELRRGTTLDYIRNTANVGSDANFLQCYERSRGKYVWIISDDDVLLPGTIGKLLPYLAEEEYELIFVAPQGFTGDPRMIKVDPSRKLPVECTDPAQFLRRVHIFTTMISSNIINKDRVAAIEHKPFSALINSNLIQLGWTFTALRAHRKSLFIGEKLVGYRHGNTGGYGVCLVFGTTLARVTSEWLGIPKLNDIVLNASLQHLLPTFLLASNRKAYGEFLDEDAHALLSSVFRHKFRYWFFDYPIVTLPARLAWLWLQLVRVINRIDRAFGYPLLTW
jgi:abequosyltransferase